MYHKISKSSELLNYIPIGLFGTSMHENYIKFSTNIAFGLVQFRKYVCKLTWHFQCITHLTNFTPRHRQLISLADLFFIVCNDTKTESAPVFGMYSYSLPCQCHKFLVITLPIVNGDVQENTTYNVVHCVLNKAKPPGSIESSRKQPFELSIARKILVA